MLWGRVPARELPERSRWVREEREPMEAGSWPVMPRLGRDSWTTWRREEEALAQVTPENAHGSATNGEPGMRERRALMASSWAELRADADTVRAIRQDARSKRGSSSFMMQVPN
jgi:hypothetical protein